MLWEAAREFGRAADYFQLAAQNASRFFAAHEAVALARRGLATFQMLAETRENKDRGLSLHVVLGTNLIATKGYCDPEVEQIAGRTASLAFPELISCRLTTTLRVPKPLSPRVA
jgi:hypothetical protein